jgi:hypothetical protein
LRRVRTNNFIENKQLLAADWREEEHSGGINGGSVFTHLSTNQK